MRDLASEHRVFQLEGEFMVGRTPPCAASVPPNIIVPGPSSPLLS
jgi:hypothetical protein